jgi:hypothetical protein
MHVMLQTGLPLYTRHLRDLVKLQQGWEHLVELGARAGHGRLKEIATKGDPCAHFARPMMLSLTQATSLWLSIK